MRSRTVSTRRESRREEKGEMEQSVGVDPPQGEDQDDHEGAEEDEDLPADGEFHGGCQLLPGVPEGVPEDPDGDDRPDDREPVNQCLERVLVCHNKYPFINLVFIGFYISLRNGGRTDVRGRTYIP